MNSGDEDVDYEAFDDNDDDIFNQIHFGQPPDRGGDDKYSS